MAKERVQKPIWQPSSQKKQSRIVPPLIDSQTEADSLPSPKVPVSNVKSKAERDAIRRSLFEKWAGTAPQPQSESEVIGHGGLSTATETIQGQEVSVAKDQMGMPIQAKLTIGKPGDKYEQEADKVANQVVNQINAPVPPQLLQSQSGREAIPEEDELQMKSEVDIIQREGMLEEEELQMKPMVQLQLGRGGMSATSELETSIKQARGSGQPLSENIRQPMEQAFGANFSGVKVHTDAQSDQLNQSIHAKAFTTGQDVFFSQGEYNPGSRKGQELIAHELTHVVQQNSNAVKRASGIAKAQDINEQHTDVAVNRMTSETTSSTPTIPTAPSSTSGTLNSDSYRQTWKVDQIDYFFSSGHGYRPVHREGGPDITTVAEMNIIEQAILTDLVTVAPDLSRGNSGERTVVVNGNNVHYRYKKFADDKVGIGTYFLQ